ncbi:MazG family protein [Pseudonocardia acaciae]|uniref:MazG family protein n=1 Tax=Pseudonocardia acaciae TaxID=551276 RepID=UPI00048A9A92|nr:MazG family protein [Pseudonocardia acaciae]
MSRTLIVVSPRMGAVLPAAALPALRAAERVVADESVSAELAEAAGIPAPVGPVTEWPGDSCALLTSDSDHPLVESADAVVGTPEPDGAALLDAVAVMDRLRSPGGCPWDAEQTHVTLLPYLIEEAYELHEAVDDADRAALREELGDVLLQVLFHARVATEGGVAPYPPDAAVFGIDEVASDLVRKLVERHPHVFGADRAGSASDLERRWDELKRVQKGRRSALDGVAHGQPAVALAAKLVSRAARAGLPEDLLMNGDGLFNLIARTKLTGADPEQQLRAAARAFAASVRTAEQAATAAGLDPHALTPEDWHRFWPSPSA